MDSVSKESSAQILTKSFQHHRTTVDSYREYNAFMKKSASLISVDHSVPDGNDHRENSTENKSIITTSNSITILDHRKSMDDDDDHHHQINQSERYCSITEMLLKYAEQDMELSTNHSSSHLNNNVNKILNVLELYFNMYANDKREIYFEGIFQILHDFKDYVTEYALVETMQLLKIDPLAACNFENFVLILCHLPLIKQDVNDFLVKFNALDYNKDAYITFDDFQYVLPRLTAYFDEEIIRVAIHAIDIDHDNGRLSYFDFVTSLILLQECKLSLKSKDKANFNGRFHTTDQKHSA